MKEIRTVFFIFWQSCENAIFTRLLPDWLLLKMFSQSPTFMCFFTLSGIEQLFPESKTLPKECSQKFYRSLKAYPKSWWLDGFATLTCLQLPLPLNLFWWVFVCFYSEFSQLGSVSHVSKERVKISLPCAKKAVTTDIKNRSFLLAFNSVGSRQIVYGLA